MMSRWAGRPSGSPLNKSGEGGSQYVERAQLAKMGDFAGTRGLGWCFPAPPPKPATLNTIKNVIFGGLLATSPGDALSLKAYIYNHMTLVSHLHYHTYRLLPSLNTLSVTIA